MKKVLLFVFFVTACLLIPNGAKYATRGFRLGKMALDLYSNPAWEVESCDHGLAQQVLSEPLYYLSHGAQSFVFESRTSPYIVKLFRYDQRVHPWRQWIRNEVLGKRKRLRHDEKIHRLFVACKLAYEKGSDLTGLVYVHLNQTEDLLPTANFIDCLGRQYHLDMNRYRFAIQHKARPIREVFLEAITAKDTAKVERLIDSFADLLKRRAERNIRNSDTKVAPNFGFWKETAIEWDFGNYWIDPAMNDPSFKAYEIGLFSVQLRKYLEKMAPEYLSYYDQIFDSELH